MNHNIDTIFFDIGNTLRIVVPDAKFQADAEAQLMQLAGTNESHDVFFEKLEANWKKFRNYAKLDSLDMSEMELWLQWLLPTYDPDRIAAAAGKLTRLWRDHDGRRVPRPGTVETIIELDRRGYKLGIIANTITETEIPDWMIEDKVAKYFKTLRRFVCASLILRFIYLHVVRLILLQRPVPMWVIIHPAMWKALVKQVTA